MGAKKKKIPSDINRGAGTGAKERRLVDSPFPDSAGWPLLIAPSRALCRFAMYPVNLAMDLVGSREGSPVRRL